MKLETFSLPNPIDKLAIFGAPPAFKEPLHVGRPNIGNRDQLLAKIGDMLDRRWFSNHGPFVQEFERRIAEYLDVRHAICVCNATVGLEIAVRAAGLQGEVIVPSYTFVATAHALQWQEIRPVFADIDPATHNLDPAAVERCITARTTGILATHLWGRPCAVEALQALAERHRLKLIFDAAHAFGCSHHGRKIGGFGTAEVFSFHATKFLNSFEGGAICTNDDELAQRIRLMTNFGFAGLDKVIHIGTNGKMTEVCAAMGLTSLESIGELIAVNRKNYETYQTELAGISGIRLVEYNLSEQNNFQYIVIEVSEEQVLTRDEIVEVLHAENILVRKYFWPGCHNMEPYHTLFPQARLLLAETERISTKVIVLPTGLSISVQMIGVICGLIRLALANSAATRKAINARVR